MIIVRVMMPTLAFAGAVCFHCEALAISGPADTATPAQLLGVPLPTSELGAARARGEIIISTSSNGAVSGNQVGSASVTGTISDAQSITNNTGITTVFQNTGNNALLQNSTSIYLSAK